MTAIGLLSLILGSLISHYFGEPSWVPTLNAFDYASIVLCIFGAVLAVTGILIKVWVVMP